MRKYGWLPAYPLHGRRHEDGRLEIISGHHRLCVAKKLGITIKYIEDKTFSEQMMHDLEVATNPWTLKDWLMSHMRTGKREYGVLYEYHKRTGISLGQCIGLLSINSGIGGERHLMGFVFVNSKGKHFSQRRLDTVWLQAARSCGIEINLYQATRHSSSPPKKSPWGSAGIRSAR